MIADVDGNNDEMVNLLDISETTKYLETFQYPDVGKMNPIIYILDTNINVQDLDEQEVSKLKEHFVFDNVDKIQIPNVALGNRPTNVSHGTKVYKFIAKTSPNNAEIRFISVADNDNIIDFHRVAHAFQHIILNSEKENIILINCSFSLPGKDNP